MGSFLLEASFFITLGGFVPFFLSVCYLPCLDSILFN